MWSIGVDVHARRSSVCILDEEGRRIKEFTVFGPPGKVCHELAQLEHPFGVCFESSCGYGYLYDYLAAVAHHVAVAHPGHLRLIFRSKKKNDRVDARKLAMLLYLDQVPTVHVPSVKVRSWRSLIEYRTRLIGKRTACKNQLRAILRSHGVEAPRGKKLWCKAGLTWLAAIELPTSQAMLQRDLSLEELGSLGQQTKRVERELNKIARGDFGVQLLRTIPGVGPRTAEAVVAYIDNPARFSRSKEVGSYFGLVPCQDQTCDADHRGRITREGPGTVRKLLTEATWQAIRRSPRLKARFERFQHGDPRRKKIAVIATAHHLIRVMHAMLRSGEPWEELKPAA